MITAIFIGIPAEESGPLPTSRGRGRGRGRHTRTSCGSEPSCKDGEEALDKRIAIDGKKMIIQVLIV